MYAVMSTVVSAAGVYYVYRGVCRSARNPGGAVEEFSAPQVVPCSQCDTCGGLLATLKEIVAISRYVALVTSPIECRFGSDAVVSSLQSWRLFHVHVSSFS